MQAGVFWTVSFTRRCASKMEFELDKLPLPRNWLSWTPGTVGGPTWPVRCGPRWLNSNYFNTWLSNSLCKILNANESSGYYTNGERLKQIIYQFSCFCTDPLAVHSRNRDATCNLWKPKINPSQIKYVSLVRCLLTSIFLQLVNCSSNEL